MKTYVALEGNRSHVTQTAWALMALILTGQVFSLMCIFVCQKLYEYSSQYLAFQSVIRMKC